LVGGCKLSVFSSGVATIFTLPNKWGAKVGIVKLIRKFDAKQVFAPANQKCDPAD